MITFIGDLVKLLLFMGFILYPSGLILLKLIHIPVWFWQKFILAVDLGIIFVTLVYFLTLYLGLPQLLFPVLLLPLGYLLVKNYPRITKNRFRIITPQCNWPVLVIVLVSVVIQASVNFTSGEYDNKLRLINNHNFDTMWMLALTNSVSESIPPKNPLHSHSVVQNYHYFLNIFLAITHKITSISLITLAFQLIPILFLSLLSATVYLFIKELTGSVLAAVGGVMMLTLTSNLYYLVPLFIPGSAVNPSVFWINEFETRIVNYQLLLSYILLFAWLYLVMSVSTKFPDKKSVLLLGMIGGSLVSFKSFIAALLIPSLIIIGLWQLIKGKKFYLLLGFTTTVFTFLFFFSANPAFQSAFILQPFYLVQSMFESSDHLNYPDWILKIQTYFAEGNIKRVIQLYTQGILLFLVGNLGFKILGLAAVFQQKEEEPKKTMIRLMTAMAIIGFAASLLLVAKGIAWNSVQFSYYSVVLLSVLFVYFISKILASRLTLKIAILVVAWLVLLPGVYFTVQSYVLKTADSDIDQSIYLATNYLSGQPKGVILINPKYSQTSLIPALSGQQAYLANPNMIALQLVDYSQEGQSLKAFFGNHGVDRKFLSNEKIKYIFTDKSDAKQYELNGLSLIHQSGDIRVYKVNPN